jgi:hypothetical protein
LLKENNDLKTGRSVESSIAASRLSLKRRKACMTRTNVEDLQRLFGYLCILFWRNARRCPRKPDDLVKWIALLNPGELLCDVIVPTKKFIECHAGKLQLEQAQPKYESFKKKTLKGIFKYTQLIFFLGMTCLSAFKPEVFYPFMSEYTSNVYFYFAIIIFIIFFVMYVSFSFLSKKEMGKTYGYYIEGDYVKDILQKEKNEILERFFKDFTLPFLRFKLRKIIEETKKMIERLQEMIVSIIAKLYSESSSRKDMQSCRSFGGIASEISMLSDLIASLALSETRTTSLAVV